MTRRVVTIAKGVAFGGWIVLVLTYNAGAIIVHVIAEHRAKRRRDREFVAAVEAYLREHASTEAV